MHDPSQTSPANEHAEADSQGPLDLTQPRAANDGAEPNFAAPKHQGEIGTLGRYRVLQKLGQGGMGAVYLGYDSALERKVALKVMLPGHATNTDARERFLREARAAAKIKSDHVVTIHDVGEEHGIPFIALEYLLGAPLDQFLKEKGELPLAQSLRVVRETAIGLAAAHALGLIHRDIKPGNLWLEAPMGRVKILDFGLARTQNDDVHLTNSGAVVGTPAYMSPEQARGLKVDSRTDLFSLGVLLYRLTTGKMPFTGTTTMAVLTSLAVDDPTPIRQINPELPESLEAIVTKLLAKDPAERFQSAIEVADAIRAIEQAKPTGPLPRVVAIPVQPMVVGAQTQNVWESIDESDSVPVPLATPVDTEVESAPQSAPKRERKRPERKASKVPAILAIVLLLVAVAGLVAVLWPKKQPEVVQNDDPAPSNRSPGSGKSPAPKKKDEEPPLVPPPDSAVYPLPKDLIPPMTLVKPKEVFSLDYLDPKNPKHIPPEEKVAWLPPDTVAVLGSHLPRRRQMVTAIAISPDSKTVLAGESTAKQAIDIKTGLVLDLPPLTAFSPHGERGAHGNKVWELADLKKPPVEYPIPGAILEFLTDDVVLVTDEGKYVAWKLNPNGGAKPLGNFPKLFSWTVSNDRKYLAIIGKDGSCGVFDITPDGPKEKFVLPGPEGKVSIPAVNLCRASFSDTGLLATVDPEGRVHVWDVTGDKAQLRHTIDEKGGAAVALFPKGNRVIRMPEGAFVVWSLEGEKPQKLVTSPPLGIGTTLSVAVTPDEQTIITGHLDGAVRFWGIENGMVFERNLRKPPLQPSVAEWRGDFSPDGRFAAIVHDDATYLWNLTDLTARKLEGSQRRVRFAPDGSVMVYANDTSGQRVISRVPGAVPFATGQEPLCYFPNGKWLLAGRAAADWLAVWDVAVEPPQERFPRTPASEKDKWFWQITPDGRFLITGSNTLKVWAMTNRGFVPRFEGPPNFTYSADIDLSPDGRTMAVSGGGGIRRYDFRDGVPALRSSTPLPVGWIAYSPDSRTMIAGVATGLLLLDAETGVTLHKWELRGQPTGGRFHPDGRHLFVTNAEGPTYVLRLPKELLNPKK